MTEARVEVIRTDQGWAYYRFVDWAEADCPCACHGRDDGEVPPNRQTCDHCARIPRKESAV